MTKGDLPWILGISASHNGAACLLKGDEIVVAIQEERLTRIKRDRIFAGERSLAVEYCLDYAGIQPEDLSLVVLSVTGRSNDSRQDLRQNPLLRSVPAILIPHHLAHAISAFATSGFKESAVLVVDGSGSPYEDLGDEERNAVVNQVIDGYEIISLYFASDTSLVPLEKHLVEFGDWVIVPEFGMPLFGSLGGMYSAVAKQLFSQLAEAGKVMGLAGYGVDTMPPEDFFDIRDSKFFFLDTVPRKFLTNARWPEESREYENLACSVQKALECALLYLAKHLRDLSGSESLCYAGGVALNSVANERIIRETGFNQVFIAPAAEDSGAAIGAAYHGLWQITGQNTRRKMIKDACGRVYGPPQVFAALERFDNVKSLRSQDVISDAVELLCEGKLLGWFDGQSELGPRALGQRSIICDPRQPQAKEILNSRVKKRESFRPFAPVIVREEVENWFEVDGKDPASPFMLRACRFKPEKMKQVPAVVHVDATGRVQTVTAEANGRFYELVKKFFEKTGVPILLNTSFNVSRQPIVESPSDAVSCLLDTGLDACVFADRIVFKYFHW